MQQNRMDIYAHIENSMAASETLMDRWQNPESSINLNAKDYRASLLKTDYRGSRKLSRKFYRQIRNPTSHSKSSNDWDDETVHNSQSETDSRYSSQESLDLGNLSDASTTSDEFVEEDFLTSPNSKGQYSSSTNDTYDPSDDEISCTEFFDTSSCFKPEDTNLDQSIQPERVNCTCLSPATRSNKSFRKCPRKTNSLARSKEQASTDKDNLIESRGKSHRLSQDNFPNIVDTDSTAVTTRNSSTNLKTATDADSINDPAKLLAEEQCWMRLDILLRLKDMLQEIVNDYKEYGTEVCTDVERRMTEIIRDNEKQLKEQVSPELLEKIEEQISHCKLVKLETHAPTSVEISRIPVPAPSNWNWDIERTSDSDSSDSDDDSPSDDSEEFKKYFDKYQTFIAQVKFSGKAKLRSWRDDIDSQQRENWIESIAHTAATQVVLKPGKEIDREGLKKFGESIEWEIFNSRATSAVEYSNMLCDIHSDIGHGRMTKYEREYLMFLATKKPT